MKDTVREIVNKAAVILEGSDCSSPRLDAELLLCHLLNKDRSYVFMYPQERLPESISGHYLRLVDERKKGKPLQYITGHQEFMKLDFMVNESVLIPRPDTEILVEEALKIIKDPKNRIQNILDIGCGSGAINISIAYYAPSLLVSTVDISREALEAANQNAAANGVSARIQFLQGDLFEPVTGKYDMIVSNPPYIRRDEIRTLQTEVSDFEPKMALDGGIDGLDFYRRIILEAPDYINESGHLLLEIGYDQANDIIFLLKKQNSYSDISIIKDLAGLDRVIRARVNMRD